MVASHFSGGGLASPRAVVPRAAYLAVMTGMAVVLPVLGGVQFSAVLRRPGARINLPNGEYWLAPARQAETFAFLRAWFTVLPMMVVLLLCDVHWLVVRANAQSPARMDTHAVGLAVVAFAAALVVWLGALFWRFGRPQ